MHNSSAVATQQGPVTVSIVVACYDRMGLLERTLKACMAQTGMPVDATWEIVVADNHPRRLATAVVSRLQADSPVALRHIPAGERNIAHARNCGIAAARGSFIAFVDDDEAPDPDWLQAHLGCLNRTGADAGFGPKYPVFAGGSAPEWDPAGRSYTTDFHMPQDAEIHPLRWFPPQARGLGTGNSMMRRATCLAGKTPFDEEFGRCGGEDTLLLLGLAQQGRRFVWCADARVREFNEASRMTFSYMCKRMQRSSRHSAMVRMEISQHRAATRLGIYGVALAQMAVYGSLWLLRRKPADYLQICKALGKLGLGSLDFIPEPPVAPARS